LFYKFIDPNCILRIGPRIRCLTRGECRQRVEFYSP